MASSPQSFNKRQRERAKKEKAAAKRARRQARPDDDAAEASEEGPDEDALLEQFRVLNEQHAAGSVDAEEFETRKQEIFEQLGLGEG